MRHLDPRPRALRLVALAALVVVVGCVVPPPPAAATPPPAASLAPALASPPRAESAPSSLVPAELPPTIAASPPAPTVDPAPAAKSPPAPPPEPTPISCPGQPRPWTVAEGDAHFSQVQKGWARSRVLKHLGGPTRCDGAIWSYVAGPYSGPEVTYAFTFSKDVVVDIKMSGVGCRFYPPD